MDERIAQRVCSRRRPWITDHFKLCLSMDFMQPSQDYAICLPRPPAPASPPVFPLQAPSNRCSTFSLPPPQSSNTELHVSTTSLPKEIPNVPQSQQDQSYEGVSLYQHDLSRLQFPMEFERVRCMRKWRHPS